MSWLPRKTVVVPVDFSERSAEALRLAQGFVKTPADIHALHVLLPMELLSPGAMWGAPDEESRQSALKEHFDNFLETTGCTGVTVGTRVGDPGLEISDYAKDVGADLVVISSHGYHGLKRLVMGSVAERVLRRASCEVLVLKRGESEEDMPKG